MIVTHSIGLSQMELEHLVRSRSDRPSPSCRSQVEAYLDKRVHDTSKLWPRQCPVDVHNEPSKAESLDLAYTGDKLFVLALSSGRDPSRG